MEGSGMTDREVRAESPGVAPRVVIIGGGFGGLSAARALRHSPVAVTVIDKTNHHLFQPLLYQVATAGLSPADIAAPIRHILKDQRNAQVLLGRVTAIDTNTRSVSVGCHRVPYDKLIIATGALTSYFGHDWEADAPGLKTVEDATSIRAKILLAFERAESTSDPDERRRHLTFVIVGGGPTGVELAGAIAELADRALAGDFRTIDPRSARLILLEGGPRVLSAFPERLSASAERSLAKLRIEVRCGAMVEAIDSAGVLLPGERIEARTVLWAAGVQASPAAEWLGIEPGPGGRVPVEQDLSVPGLPEVYVVGDAALAHGRDGRPLPGIAPVAKQQGAYVGRLIAAQISGRPSAGAFRYRDYGNLATIGRSHAVADFGWLRLSGNFAWLLWCFVHIFYLIGFRNKATVMLQWIWAYVTFQRGMRLITGPTDEA